MKTTIVPMIKASEFRIGNWINYEGTLTQLADVLSGFLFEPIPLTPEILEKIGFVKNEQSEISVPVATYYDYILKKKGENVCSFYAICIHHNDENRSVVKYMVNDYWASPEDCIYVHQLQNLYFALTGEELNIPLL